MIRPDALKKNEPLVWSAGTGTDVWDLFCACIAGDLESVRRLVTTDPSLVRAHYEYRTPLSFAVRENRLDVAAFLLDHGADRLGVGGDLVEVARDRGYDKMEELLTRRFASLHGASSKGEAVAAAIRERDPKTCDVWTAAHLGDLARVSALLDQDPSLVNRVADYGDTGAPLVKAAAMGHLDVARLLLERGADPNLPEEGMAPHGRALYAAVYNGHLEVARLLLEHGAYPNPEVESSADALSIAIMNSDTRMIDLLASYGAVWRIPVQLAPEPVSS